MNNIEKHLEFIKGNVKRYRVEVIINHNIISDILINIDFLSEEDENKTFIISLNENNINDDFLFLFQNILINLESNTLKVQTFVLELQKLFNDINKLIEFKEITGNIIFEYLSETLPNNFVFEGTINNEKTYFKSSSINIDYFKNMNYDLFIQKEY
jgi:hypothetical protein